MTKTSLTGGLGGPDWGKVGFCTGSGPKIAFSATFFEKFHSWALRPAWVGKRKSSVTKQGLVSPFLRFPLVGIRRNVGWETLHGGRGLTR